MRKKYLVNEEIHFNKVILINNEKRNLGENSIDEALSEAYSKNLDLVCIDNNKEIPVCKIMDYGKLLYDKKKKEKENKKNQKTIETKIARISPVISDNDLNTKISQIKKWLLDGKKVKIEMKLKGRMIYKDKLIDKIIKYIITSLDNINIEHKCIKERNYIYIDVRKI